MIIEFFEPNIMAEKPKTCQWCHTAHPFCPHPRDGSFTHATRTSLSKPSKTLPQLLDSLFIFNQGAHGSPAEVARSRFHRYILYDQVIFTTNTPYAKWRPNASTLTHLVELVNNAIDIENKHRSAGEYALSDKYTSRLTTRPRVASSNVTKGYYEYY